MTDAPSLDLHTIRIVRAISEHGTISGAAAALGYSQPALSQHLRRAERRIGAPLLLRVGRGVRLTDPGRAVLRHAGAVLSALRVAEQELATIVGQAGGTVRLAAFPSASSTLVPALLGRLAASRPDLRVEYTEAEPPEALADLSSGAVDVAVTFSYPGDPSDPLDNLAGATTVALFDDPVVVVLPATHALASRPTVRLAELADESWVAGCPLCRGHLLAACASAGVTATIKHATDNSVAVLGLVAAGAGIALQPRLALEPLELPTGTTTRSVDPASDRVVRASALRGADAVPAVRAVLEALVEITERRRHPAIA